MITSPTRSRTALILGGGGSTGNAWMVGVVAGLYDSGLDVASADLTIGTSAGSTTAVQIAGTSSAQLFAEIVAVTADSGARSQGNPRQIADALDKRRAMISTSHDVIDMRKRLGAAALERGSQSPGAGERWRATVASRLPLEDWPSQRLLITAIDARTGEPVVFDSASGVELVDAVAASCSSSVAYPIGEQRYLDGGYRTNAENADLAAGYERVLILSPFSGRTLTPVEWGLHLSTQIDDLRAGGSRVESIFPDGESEQLFRANAMNLSLRAPAAKSGYELGVANAERLKPFWLDTVTGDPES